MSQPSVEEDYPQRTNLMTFDNSDVNMFDVELVVEEQGFYVMKGFLARQSTTFRSLFFDDYKEKGKKKIELKDIGAYEFQLFLECIHGCQCIDENTVELIAKMAERWNAQLALAKCEEFLMKEPKEKMKKCFEIAVQYKMDKLKTKLITDIKTADEFIHIAPTEYNTTLNAKTLFEFLQKAIFLLTSRISNLPPPTRRVLTGEQARFLAEEHYRHTIYLRSIHTAHQHLTHLYNQASDQWDRSFQAAVSVREQQNPVAPAAVPGPEPELAQVIRQPVAPLNLNVLAEWFRAAENMAQQQHQP